MAVALVALFSSLVGGAAAATLITGSDIAKNAIAKKHIKANAVRTGKVKNGTLLSEDFKAGQLPAGAMGPIGPVGPAGAAGAKGDKGDKGDTGAAGTNGTNGTNGTDGTNGATGPAGPTAGFIEYDGGTPNGDTTVHTTSVTLPTAGKLWIVATHMARYSCAAAQCGYFYTLRVDGAALSTSGTNAISGEASVTTHENVTVVGLTGTLPAGIHAIELRRGVNTGTPTNIGAVGELNTIGAILLGG
jgi:hypothetical protein